MNGRIVLEELNRELSGHRAKVDGWAQAKMHSADQLRSKHEQTLLDLRGDIARLEAEKAMREQELEDTKQRLLQERSACEKLQSELDNVQSVCQTLPARNQLLQQTLDKEAQELQRQEAALADNEALREGKLHSLRQALDVYRARLGLQFRKDRADELLLVFTHLDPTDHLREFYVGVHVQDDNTYSVTRCEPALEGLDAMVADLNRTNSFKTFVREARRQFQQMMP